MSIEVDTRCVDSHLSREDIRSIRKVVERAVRVARAHLAIDDVRVRVFIEADQVRPFFGLVAYTCGPHLVSVILDPQYPRWRYQEGRVRFSSVMAHEFYHVMRCRGPDSDRSTALGARLVSEGLATNFEEETGHPSLSSYTKMTDEYLKDLTQRAVPLLRERPDAQGQFGTGTAKPFPSSGIHTLGWALVKMFLSANQYTPSEAIHLPAEQILQWWLTSLSPERPLPTADRSGHASSRATKRQLVFLPK
jgi:uncharacterized protein YjaZ